MADLQSITYDSLTFPIPAGGEDEILFINVNESDFVASPTDDAVDSQVLTSPYTVAELAANTALAKPKTMFLRIKDEVGASTEYTDIPMFFQSEAGTFIGQRFLQSEIENMTGTFTYQIALDGTDTVLTRTKYAYPEYAQLAVETRSNPDQSTTTVCAVYDSNAELHFTINKDAQGNLDDTLYLDIGSETVQVPLGSDDTTYTLDYVKENDEWFTTLSDGTDTQRLAVPPEWYQGGGSGMAALFDYVTTDPVDTQGAHDIAAYMSAYLNLPGMATGVGTSNLGYKVPTLTVGDYTWTSPDAEGNQTATADVTITFADGSTLTKTLNFKTGQSYRVYAARSTDGAYIDTGMTLNYAYTFRATGFLPGTNMGVFIGALSSSATRTTARLLGSSQKMQHMWPGNTEYTTAQIGGAIAFSLGEEFAVQYSATEFVVWNGSGVRYNATVSGKTQTGTENVPILLFDETAGGGYKNAVIRNARIYDENGYEVRNYWPMMLNNEIVYVDTAIGIEDNIMLDLIAKGPYSEYAGYVYHTPVGALEEVNQV